MFSRRHLAAIAGLGLLVGAGVQRYLPLAIRQPAPDGDISAGRRHWIPVHVFAVPFKVAPGVALVARRSHLRVSRRPGQLIDLGIPISGFLNRDFANQWRSSVAQRHAVLGKPGGEARPAARQHVLGKARLQIVKQNLAGVRRRVRQRIGRNLRVRIRKRQLPPPRAWRKPHSRQ